jgi:hypothetical protein
MVMPWAFFVGSGIVEICSTDKVVETELERIGKADMGSDQATLRNEYAAYRREDLARDPHSPPREALFKAIISVRRYAPDFEPQYDTTFFRPG